MNTFWMVMLGSWMTLSPLFKTLITGFVFGIWSAINGDTLDLTPPVPIPMIITAAIKPPKEAFLLATEGNEVMNKMKIPMM